MPYELLVCTNASVQPGFAPPPNTSFKNALRYYVQPVNNTYFPTSGSYYPLSDPLFNDYHEISYNSAFTMKEDTTYQLSFWIRMMGQVHDISYHLAGYRIEPGEDHAQAFMEGPVDSSGDWHRFEEPVQFHFDSRVNASNRHDAATVSFHLRFSGQGELYLDDVSLATQEDEKF